MRLKRGYVHIYTGKGKGKTTASLGIGVRGALNGLRVCMFQFLKKKGSSAENRLKFPNFKVLCFDEIHPMFSCQGSGFRVQDKLRRRIAEDLKKVKKAIESRQYDMVILDEIVNCVSEGFLDEGEVLDLLQSRPRSVEVILTGRGATNKMKAAADYVTQLTESKHPFNKGVLPRKGIEF